MTRGRTRHIALAFAVALPVSCGKDKTRTEPPIRPVRYQEVEASGGIRTRAFSGVTGAGVESKLSFKIAGTLRKLPIKVGDKVEKGALIAELDKTDVELELQQARASYTSAAAQARNAKASYERVQALYENQNASKGDLDAARAGYESARGNVNAVGQQVAMLKQKLSYTRLVAPVAGAVANVHVETNENVGSGAPVVTLASGDKPKVTVAIPGKLITKVKEGATVTVTCDVVPGKKLGATVSEVGVSSTGAGATFAVTVQLDEAHPQVRPGMAAEVEFQFGSKDEKQRYLVPPASVGEDRSGRFVFVVEKTQEGFGVVHRKPVTVGELTADGLEVVEGLKEGELLVTAGVTRIQDGIQVKVPAAADKAAE